jgi:hypothetical protein
VLQDLAPPSAKPDGGGHRTGGNRW